MSLLDPRTWIAALLVVLASYGAGRWHQHRADATRHQAELLHAVQAARAEEQRRTTEQTEIANDATKKADAARADARAAAVTADRLRQRLAQLVAGNPGATAPGSPTGDAIGVLADVLGRADKRAGILADYADAARIAGQACEQSYGALTK